jgi:hypothetical protein
MEKRSGRYSYFDWVADGVELMLPTRMMRRLVPPETRSHLRAARREMMLATRSVLDSAINRMEEPSAAKETTTTRIKVD